MILSPDITRKNYFTWVVDAMIHLGDTIKKKNTTSSQDRANAMIFICRHMHEELKSEYLAIEDQLALWNALRDNSAMFRISS